MRYREGETPHLPALDETMFIMAAVLGLLMGFGFVLLGIKVKRHWLTIWGGGLVLSSIAYLVYAFT